MNLIKREASSGVGLESPSILKKLKIPISFLALRICAQDSRASKFAKTEPRTVHNLAFVAERLRFLARLLRPPGKVMEARRKVASHSHNVNNFVWRRLRAVGVAHPQIWYSLTSHPFPFLLLFKQIHFIPCATSQISSKVIF